MTKINYLRLLLCIFFVAIPPRVLLANDFQLSVGNLCEFVGKIQTNENGDKNFCSVLPVFSAANDFFLSRALALSPQIGATLPKSGRDPNIKRMTMFALLNAKYKTQYLNFIVGTGLYLTRIWGPGGEAVLNNGNSTDSFPLPKEAVYSRNFILHLGLGHDFNQEWSLEAYSYIFNTMEKEDRAYSVGLSLSHHFGNIL